MSQRSDFWQHGASIQKDHWFAANIHRWLAKNSAQEESVSDWSTEIQSIHLSIHQECMFQAWTNHHVWQVCAAVLIDAVYDCQKCNKKSCDPKWLHCHTVDCVHSSVHLWLRSLYTECSTIWKRWLDRVHLEHNMLEVLTQDLRQLKCSHLGNH